ncbi:hypothetical protein WwSim0211 [Wolbachia endosymbiont of Drosophila simulans]|nr:hypothetical protein WwSim0211 [Wolbachia endosymbiont of Drosophila simulans]
MYSSTFSPDSTPQIFTKSQYNSLPNKDMYFFCSFSESSVLISLDNKNNSFFFCLFERRRNLLTYSPRLSLSFLVVLRSNANFTSASVPKRSDEDRISHFTSFGIIFCKTSDSCMLLSVGKGSLHSSNLSISSLILSPERFWIICECFLHTFSISSLKSPTHIFA